MKKVLFIAGVVLVTPVSLALAVERPIRAEMKDSNCDEFAAYADSAEAKYADWEARKSSHRSERRESASSRQQSREETLNEKRAIASARRAKLYANMESKAKTNEQKQAVVEFQRTVEAAVAKRIQKIDSAVSAFKTDAGAAVQSKDAETAAARKAFKASIEKIVSDAKNACLQDGNIQRVKVQMKKDISAATTRFRSATQGVNDGDIRALSDTRKKAIDAALEEFRVEVRSASEALRGAIKTSTESESAE